MKRIFFTAIIFLMILPCLFGQVLSERLIDSVLNADFTELKRLVQSGLDVRSTDYYDNTLLMYSMEAGTPEMVEYLLSRRISPRNLNTSNQNPLHILAARAETLPIILDFSAISFSQVNHEESNNVSADVFFPDTLLIARMLIAEGADVNLRDIHGATPLLLSAAYGAVWLMEELISSGADVGQVNLNGWTPLMSAAAAGQVGAVELLLSKGANAESVSFFGDTALQLAAKSGREQSVQALLLSGADPSVANQNGRTALDLAANEKIRTLLEN